ncbi:MAG TPA: 50S ribosomal protein L6 [Ktedonobacterales bacterium]|jgi:large subunit ribosomal protein L6|nr:50S ribosomal protein L6 [Ktedonobacterales bacterium]
MSRIGKAPIPVPAGVTVDLKPDRTVTVKGPKGTLVQQFEEGITIKQDAGVVTVGRVDDSNRNRALHGLSRTLLANMVIGVTTGFTKALEINGVGYRVAKVGDHLVFQVGYSHPVQMDAPPGITFVVEGTTKLSVSGVDKQLVGQVAANIRSIRKPEPYKGKGIKYATEVIRRKAGKAGKVGGKKK